MVNMSDGRLMGWLVGLSVIWCLVGCFDGKLVG